MNISINNNFEQFCHTRTLCKEFRISRPNIPQTIQYDHIFYHKISIKCILVKVQASGEPRKYAECNIIGNHWQSTQEIRGN